MIKEIKYNGLTNTPSDYENPDGDLAAAINIVPEDGMLRPILPPTTLFSLNADEKVLYIHITTSFTHYIITDTSNQLYWKDDIEGSLQSLHSFSYTTINQVNAIGNTLVILASDGMHYLLWKGEKEGYLYLGTEIPELPISFGLQGEVVRSDVFNISFNSIGEGDLWAEFSDENKTKITDQVLAKVNKFINERSTKAGKFIYPFLVRYAFRMYDGSLTKHSAPILMVCSSDLAPQVFYEHITGKESYTDAELRIVGVLQTLDYAVIGEYDIRRIKEWQDIIRSVDVFISAPIYTYDQTGQCTRFIRIENSDCYCICKHINQAANTNVYPLRYQYNQFSKLYAFTFNPHNFSYPAGRLMLPRKTDDDVKEAIRNCSTFYFLESIKIDTLTTTRTKIEPGDEYLTSLVAKEVMTDDYDSHDKLYPKYAFSYNQRLNIANIRKRLFQGFNSWALFPHSNGFVNNFHDGSPTSIDYTVGIDYTVFIKQDNRDIIVSGTGGSFGLYCNTLFFYYPNVNAYRVLIHKYMFGTLDLKLEQHAYLNGSFYFGGWEDNTNYSDVTYTNSTESECMVDISNKIYTSEINNPFYFPLKGINTVGTGEIMGICSAVKALSQGQFGQFPLYAFTTEGVWALEVSAEGTYSARQPVTRDICTNPASITQIDSAVLFATERGIMLISGSESQCITDILNNSVFRLDSLPAYDRLLQKANLPADCFDYIPFKDFIAGCGMTYDYKNQRIIVFHPSKAYAFIYSMKSKQWGMMQSNFTDAVNSYPDAYVMTSDSRLVNLSEPNKSDNIQILALSRPMRLDMPDVLKTIDTTIQRGMFSKGHVSQVLYGSRDLYNWFIITSSIDHYLRGFRGTPFKYFRFVLIGTLQRNESISGCSISFTPRQTNQLR